MVLERPYDFSPRRLSAWDFHTICGACGNIDHFFKFWMFEGLYRLQIETVILNEDKTRRA